MQQPFISIQRSLLSIAVAHSLLIPALFVPTTNAATITVNSTLDTQNPAGCSLREAIQVSNTNSVGGTGCQTSNGALNNSDEIVFDLVGNNRITLSGSQLEITQTVSINGPGAEQLIIDANDQSRVLSVVDSENTRISNLTFTGGNSDYAPDFVRPDRNSADFRRLADGGAISISNSNGSIISDSVITNSVANDGDGAGISIDSSDGFVINNSVISGNVTEDPSIRFYGDRTSRGGGIFIYNSNFVAINNSTVIENTSTLEGGGIEIYLSDNVSINNSTISGNNVLIGNGGGISIGQNYSGESENFFINSSTISNNIALNLSQVSSGTAGGSGGGMYIADSNGIIVNSTISGNIADRVDRAGGGIGGNGGFGEFRNSVTLYSSTVVNNSGYINQRFNRGGGIYFSNGNFNLAGNNIIANNIGDDCNFSTNLSSGINWIGDDSCLSTPTPILRGDPQLGPLQDNGGPTFTHAPLSGSGLINASTNCDDVIVNGIDQRGEARGTDVCFIGSVEGVQEDTVNFNVIRLSNGKTVVIPL